MAGLTDELIRKQGPAPAGKRIEIQDDEPSQLYLRVTDKGVRTFTVRYRLKGKDEPVGRLTLGTYPDMRLTEARNLARRAMLEVRAGNDPKTLKPRPKGEMTSTASDNMRAHETLQPCLLASVRTALSAFALTSIADVRRFIALV
jgi:Arm DNA-binding domain